MKIEEKGYVEMEEKWYGDVELIMFPGMKLLRNNIPSDAMHA